MRIKEIIIEEKCFELICDIGESGVLRSIFVRWRWSKGTGWKMVHGDGVVWG
jgi:hypothetical protein